MNERNTILSMQYYVPGGPIRNVASFSDGYEMLLHEIKSMYLFETEKLKSSSVYVFDKSQSIVQGQSWQTGFF